MITLLSWVYNGGTVCWDRKCKKTKSWGKGDGGFFWDMLTLKCEWSCNVEIPV